jgi:hypothetical protein
MIDESQDVFLLAFNEGLAEAAGVHQSSRQSSHPIRTKCLTRQSALDILRSAVNPSVPYSEGSIQQGNGGRGVYVALSMYGYFERALVALRRVDSSGDLVREWQAWLPTFTGSWSNFWSTAEAFLCSHIPSLIQTWLHDEVQVIGKSLLAP